MKILSLLLAFQIGLLAPVASNLHHHESLGKISTHTSIFVQQADCLFCEALLQLKRIPFDQPSIQVQTVQYFLVFTKQVFESVHQYNFLFYSPIQSRGPPVLS